MLEADALPRQHTRRAVPCRLQAPALRATIRMLLDPDVLQFVSLFSTPELETLAGGPTQRGAALYLDSDGSVLLERLQQIGIPNRLKKIKNRKVMPI